MKKYNQRNRWIKLATNLRRRTAVQGRSALGCLACSCTSKWAGVARIRYTNSALVGVSGVFLVTNCWCSWLLRRSNCVSLRRMCDRDKAYRGGPRQCLGRGDCRLRYLGQANDYLLQLLPTTKWARLAEDVRQKQLRFEWRWRRRRDRRRRQPKYRLSGNEW